MVDESDAGEGQILFGAPDRSLAVLIAATQETGPNPNADALRGELFEGFQEDCQQNSIAFTRTDTYSGIDFATVGATCQDPGQTLALYDGVGLRGQVAWGFVSASPSDQFEANRNTIIEPMLRTLNIYGNP